ncbi:E3 ubiquitin-protein ligase listerin [Trichinella spiralis]|uniref:E3 ubiquitin-protein ligase listerin n=1 Tax=Trichinella spiralis TaxID=6334 RepID=A0A0V1B0F6_TRISP|nr:E3 ubiquitin-protein ligase listerin [Trichinella spiralis]
MVVRGGTSLLMSVNGDAKVGVHIPIDDYKFYFDYWRSRIIMVRRRYQRAQPSNSRRAAELVAESGGLRTFSVFAQNTASDSNVTAVTMMSLPIPFKDVFKKIFKKEVDTKYKGMSELINLIAVSDVQQVMPSFAYWNRFYARSALDPISGIRKLSHEVCTAFLMKVLPCQRKPVDDALIYLLLGVFDPKKEVAVTAKDGINFFNSVTNTEFNSLFTENWCRTCCRMLINDEGTIPALSELDSRLDVTLSICLESLSWALGRSLITEGSPQFGVVQSLGKCITFWDLPLLCDEKLDLVNSWYRTVQSLVPVFIHSSQSLILKRLYTSIQKSMTSIQLCTFRYMFGVISELNKLVEDVWVHVDCGRFISCLATAISDSLDSDSLCDGAKLFAPFFAILPPASDDVKIQRIGLVVTNLAVKVKTCLTKENCEKRVIDSLLVEQLAVLKFLKDVDNVTTNDSAGLNYLVTFAYGRCIKFYPASDQDVVIQCCKDFVEFVIKLSDMNSSFKPFLEDLCKHVLLMVDSLLEDDTVASENLSLLISNLLYPESALLHRFIKPIFEQILDTQRFWLLNQNCDFDENLEKFKKLCEMERSIETDASKYVKKIYESMSNVNRFLLLESNDRVSAMQIYFLLVNLMNEEDRTMALDRIYKMEHFSIIETIAALTSSNKMKFDFSRYHPADSARRFLNCLLHDDCLTIEKSCKEVANLLLTFLKEIKTEESPLNVILNREALRHWSNVAKVAVLARGLFMCEEFWNGHLKEEACRLLITLFTYCYGEHGKNVICSLESDVDTLRGSVTIALLYAFHTITSMGEFSVADSLLEQMSSLVREEVFEKELSQERISYAKEYAKVIFHCMNHCKQVDSAYSTKFICDQLLPSHDQWIKFMDTLASEWRALAVVNNALPASILNADNFSGEVFPRNLAEDEENMCRYLNMRSYFCLIGVFCANVAKSKAADKPVSIQYIRQLFDIFGTAQYLHLARSNCFDFGFFKQFDSILTDTQYCDDRLSCFVFHLIKGKMVPNFVFEFDGSDEPLCLLGLSNLLAKDVKLLNKLSHDDGFSDVVGISDEEGSESKSFAASDVSCAMLLSDTELDSEAQQILNSEIETEDTLTPTPTPTPTPTATATATDDDNPFIGADADDLVASVHDIVKDMLVGKDNVEQYLKLLWVVNMPLSSGIPLQQDDQMELTKENFVDIFTAARLYSDDMLEKLFQKLVDDIDQIDKFIFEEGDDTENCVRHLTYLQLLQLLFDRGYEFKRKMIENIFFMLTRIMEFSARLKGIQFVVHCIMGLHCCNMLSEKLNYNKFTHLTEEEQLQCKQEWFQFFLCQCIDNHLDTFFYHAENFSNCTMRRLLIYRLAVFISSLPRDALMKPVKNVLLSAKLSALNYPESLQTIISRMLMLLRKQTATSFIFGLAAYFCLRKLLPDVAIYEKSEAQNGLMKEVPSYFHEFLDDVRQASSVSRFSNSFLIFMYKYMIIWKLLFEYIAIVDKSQQDGYREWLYQQQHFIHLWRILVTFFVEHPADVEQVKKAINLFSPIESGRNAQKMNIVMFTDDVFNKISDTASVVWWLSLCVFRDFLTLFPTVTRQFWRSEKLLTSRIKRCKKKEKQYITLCPNVSEVVIAYGKDDFTISFTMKLPSNYPLNSTDVFLNVASGVPKDSFNFWIRKLAMRLQKHETNLLDSLLLWQAEVDKVLERMDVCPVCLSYTTSEGHLPSKKCYQCKHQFHGSCLQQWFQSTDRPSCPLCRELFVQNCSVDYCLLGKRNWIWGFSE